MLNLNFDFTWWDLVMLVAVSMMCMAMAYLRHPKWKVVVLSLPIPFSVATLSLGQNVNATHVLGLFFLILYTHGVRLLHVKLGVPILLSIGIAAGGYATLAVRLAGVMPTTEAAFWSLTAAMVVLLLALLWFSAHRSEPGHRTPLPVWIKLPAIIAIVLALIISKKMLQGFMTMFPMVGLLGAYESRHCLWTVCRTLPAAALCMLPLMAVVHVVQPGIGLGLALLAGWFVYAVLMTPTMLWQLRLIDRANRDACVVNRQPPETTV